jgi:hypothetical protein
MKKKIIYGAVAIALIGSLAIPYGCKKVSPDNYTISVNTDVFSAPTSLLFVNAKEGADKQPADFALTISGKDANQVITSLGKNASYPVTNGFSYLSLKKGVVPTAENPIVFKISGKAEGFESFVYDVVLTENSESNLEFKLIEEGVELPRGLSELKTSAPLTGGSPTAPVVIQTEEETGTVQTAKMEMAAGTVMTGTDGKALTGTNLDVKVRYYDPRTEANDVVPGGLNPQDVLDKDGKPIKGGVQFMSAGMIKVDMTVDNQKVKGFDKPVATEIELTKGQDNPFTGKVLVAGDKIPTWSRNDETGQWKQEGEATVVQKGDVLVAQFDVKHLSIHAVTFYFTLFPLPTFPEYPTYMRFSFTDTQYASEGYVGDMYLENHTGRQVKVTGYSAGGTVIMQSVNIYASLYSIGIGEHSIPRVDAAYFIFEDLASGTTFKTEQISTKNTSSYTLDLLKLDTPNTINLALDYTLKCTANKIVPMSDAYATITNLDTKKKFNVRIYAPGATKKGGLKLKLMNMTNYRIETVGIDGAVISYESLLDIKNLTTKNIKGFTIDKLIYNPSTKKVEAGVTYVTSKC